MLKTEEIRSGWAYFVATWQRLAEKRDWGGEEKEGVMEGPYKHGGAAEQSRELC